MRLVAERHPGFVLGKEKYDICVSEKVNLKLHKSNISQELTEHTKWSVQSPNYLPAIHQAASLLVTPRPPLTVFLSGVQHTVITRIR